MSDVHKAFVDPDGSFCIVKTDNENMIRIIGSEAIPITSEVAENAIQQLKENPDNISIDSDGALVPIVKDSDSVI